MAYTVLARKYRSATFDDVVGQEPIARTLANAIRLGRVHHGYLFTGTRGTGKTSMARILAKSLNCLKYEAPTVTPCCECDSCRGIAEGQDVDVLEIDAASNTGVDNIRELRSNTAYRPARARFKVYIIDEVHMLSTGAFNALLKTLEEPPAHVKFILATTEVQKVPATIQSRCQRFHFRNIAPEAIAERLAQIGASEGATIDPAVTRRIARLANGSMRDALSILDQLLSVSPQRVDAALLDEMIPPPQHERLVALLEHAAAGDVLSALKVLDETLSTGLAIEMFCNDLIEVLRALLFLRAGGADAEAIDLPAGALETYQQLSQKFELSHYVQMIPMIEELRRNVRYSGAGRALTEAVVVRIARMREWTAIEQLLRQPGPAAAAPTAAGQKKNVELARAAMPAPAVPAPHAAMPAAAIPAPRAAMPGPTVPAPRAAASVPKPAPPVPSAAPASPAVYLAPDRPAAETYPGPDEQPRAVYGPPLDAEYAAEGVDDSRSRQEMRRRELSAVELAQIRQDPVVQRTAELFDAIVIRAERLDRARQDTARQDRARAEASGQQPQPISEAT